MPHLVMMGCVLGDAYFRRRSSFFKISYNIQIAAKTRFHYFWSLCFKMSVSLFVSISPMENSLSKNMSWIFFVFF